MRPLSSWAAVKAAHTSKGLQAAGQGAVVAGGPAAGLAICMQMSAAPANLPRPGGRRPSTQQLPVHTGLCACGRLCGCRGCPAPAPRPWQMAGLGSNMEARLNAAGPRWASFISSWGGSCREGISARSPSTHAPGKYLLSAYYAPLPAAKEERKNLRRSNCYI